MKRPLSILFIGLVAGPFLRAQAPEPRTAFVRRLQAAVAPWGGPKRLWECQPGPVYGVVTLPGAKCEGLAVAPNGDVFTGDLTTNAIYRVSPWGQVTLHASLGSGTPYDPANPGWYFDGVKGLGFSVDGELWACHPNPISRDRAKHGIWRVGRDGQAELAVPLDPTMAPFPNGLTFDSQGNLYFSESWKGGVWKVPRGSRTAVPWADHELLAPLPEGGFGANGIAFKGGAIYVANTDQVTLVRIPILPDGSAGAPAIHASGFGWPDGVAVGPRGDLFLIGGWEDWQVIRVRDDGSWEVVVPGGISGAASLDFARAPSAQPSLFLANFWASEWGYPTVQKVEVCK
ncbi:MAG: hypothetical protein HY823_10925 [Acidobacteria bacterium]|nr:hypothetical protein [Acidobacteriota bacterium]